MIKNNKGEVFTLTVVVLATVAAFLLGSINNPVKSFFGLGGSGQKTTQKEITKTVSEPIFVKGDDGKEYILKRTCTETSSIDTAEEPKLTIWQRLLMLPRIWLILMILGLFFPPIAGIMSIINQRLMGEAKKIVGGVEEALKTVDDKPEVKAKILDTLSKKYDGSTKLLVSKIKRKL